MYEYECVVNGLKGPFRLVNIICEDKLFQIIPHTDHWTGESFEIYEIQTRNPYARARSVLIGRDNVGNAKTIFKAKQRIRKYLETCRNREENKKSTRRAYPVEALPSGDNRDFYPTPMSLAGRMLAKVKWTDVRYILEPSAGKGDLVTAVERMAEQRKYQERHNTFSTYELRERPRQCFDVIESDSNLMQMLRGAGLRLVAEDFLTFRTTRRYDLILMNPPFSSGARHLLHAIELLEYGGQIVCLLNAETIRNPCTRDRQQLKEVLAEKAAHIEFIKNAFKHAERKTNVEVAIIYLDLPRKLETSTFFDNAQIAAKAKLCDEDLPRNNYLVVSDEVEAMIQRYNVECRAGVDFLRAYAALCPYIMNGTESYSKAMITIKISDHECGEVNNETLNSYLESVRRKYWSEFLQRDELRRIMTSSIANEYYHKVQDMAKYEFSRFNIAQVMFDIQSSLVSGVEKSIMKLFDTLTAHSLDNEKNIHFFSGWKTNSAYRVGQKAIIPGYGAFNSYSWIPGKLDENGCYSLLDDLEKTLHYLEKGDAITHWNLLGEIRVANSTNATALDLTYFRAQFYKKGTCHLKFRDDPEVQKLIERLNIFAARNRGWLPPSYGKKAYRDMDDEEKEVIDSFQGEAAYAEVLADPSSYLIDKSSLLPMLPSA